jgi:hypothetical protein
MQAICLAAFLVDVRHFRSRIKIDQIDVKYFSNKWDGF